MKTIGNRELSIGMYFCHYWSWAVLIGILIIASSFFSTYPIKLISRLIDISMGILPGGAGAVICMGLVYFTFHLLNAVTANLLKYVNKHVEAMIGDEMRRTVFRHLTILPPSFYDRNNTGEILTRLIEDSQITVLGFLAPVSYLAQSIVSFAFGLYFMLSIDWRLTLIILPVGFITSWISSQTGPRFAGLARRVRETSGKLWSCYSEGLRGIREVHANGQETRFLKRIDEHSREVARSVSVEAAFSSFVGFLNTAFFMGIIALIMTAGGLFVVNGTLSIGGLAAVMMYNGLLVDPLVRFVDLYQQLQRVKVSLARINAIFKENPHPVYERMDMDEMERPDPIKTDLSEVIRFEGVSFRYRNDKPALKDVSFSIHPGEWVAFVGETGAGKSTILKLVAGFYRPEAGNIRVFGRPPYEIPIFRWERVSLVFQDVFLFDGSIRENIVFGNPDCKEEDLEKAIRAACLDRTIVRLPEGLETRVGENGVMLSGGERQRIGIARALVRCPSLLLLDEATSALDNTTATEVIKNIRHLYPDCTCVMVAHRLGTVTDADRIFVLEQGEIAEEGRHEELIARKGKYYELFTASFIEDEESGWHKRETCRPGVGGATG